MSVATPPSPTPSPARPSLLAGRSYEPPADLVPSDPLTDHEYDGIREYDNPTPGWWHLIFIATVVFSVVYALFWHGSPVAWSIEETWNDARVAKEAKQFGTLGDLRPDPQTILWLTTQPAYMEMARGMFRGTCLQCHGADGGGLAGSGVNLTDDHYKNVRAVEDLYRVITEGAGAGAMPSQRAKFSDKQRVLLAAYAASLRGTRPASPKAPEGDVIPPWPPAPKERSGGGK